MVEALPLPSEPAETNQRILSPPRLRGIANSYHETHAREGELTEYVE